jgi:N6-adenosine-specific RNA methylase IME4
MSLNEIMALPVNDIADETAHLYLWVPNAVLPDGLAVMQAWGFTYKTNIVWHKILQNILVRLIYVIAVLRKDRRIFAKLQHATFIATF